MAGGINRYAYAGNNSLLNIDPTGEFFIAPWVARCLGGCAVGAAVAGGSSYLSDACATNIAKDAAGDCLAGCLAGMGLGGRGQVTRWQNPASKELRPNDWVMKGDKNPLNWALSGKMNPLRPKHHVPYNSGRTFSTPKTGLRKPSGLEKYKPGQRRVN